MTEVHNRFQVRFTARHVAGHGYTSLQPFSSSLEPIFNTEAEAVDAVQAAIARDAAPVQAGRYRVMTRSDYRIHSWHEEPVTWAEVLPDMDEAWLQGPGAPDDRI